MIDKKELSKERGKRALDFIPDLTEAVSSMECTGLMPSPPRSEAELESYDDIYNVKKK